jgi:hypothetical protein
MRGSQFNWENVFAEQLSAEAIRTAILSAALLARPETVRPRAALLNCRLLFFLADHGSHK